MQERYGQGNGPIILLHGGAGHRRRGTARLKRATTTLQRFARRGASMLRRGVPVLKIVEELLVMMEADPQFNAGYGSVLQADAQARLSAALMSGKRQVFSGVMLASQLRHPSRMAAFLQGRSSRVLGPPGTELLARQLNLAVESPQTADRLKTVANAKIPDRSPGFDTVGVVVVGPKGELMAGTSTGGRGMEFPGRVSDSATVAGNYASKYAAISATGTGEEIIDDALAARLETRCRDGMTLLAASEKTFREAIARNRSYGWIAVGRDSTWAVCHTTPGMSYAVINAKGDFLARS